MLAEYVRGVSLNELKYDTVGLASVGSVGLGLALALSAVADSEKPVEDVTKTDST